MCVYSVCLIILQIANAKKERKTYKKSLKQIDGDREGESIKNRTIY